MAGRRSGVRTPRAGGARARPGSGADGRLVVAAAQIAPVWLDRTRTLVKVGRWISRAADGGCDLVAFGEALVPGYPWWIEHTDGARFNSAFQKRLHAHYMHEAVDIDAGHLDATCGLAKRRRITVVLGIIERPRDRGGHSAYASLVVIDAKGRVASVHRKLMPTYEERLAWAAGDGSSARSAVVNVRGWVSMDHSRHLSVTVD